LPGSTRKVEASALAFFGDPEGDEESDKLQNEEDYGAAPGGDDCDPIYLCDDLTRIAVEKARVAVWGVSADRDAGCRKDASQNCAKEAANAMDAEYVEGVVIAEHPFELGRREEANSAGDDPDNRAVPGQNIAWSRGDGRETRQRPGNHAQYSRLTAHAPFDGAQVRAPELAARCVAMMAIPAREPAAYADPPLKPNHPTQRRPAPATVGGDQAEIVIAGCFRLVPPAGGKPAGGRANT